MRYETELEKLQMLQDETAREFSRMIQGVTTIEALKAIGSRLDRHYNNNTLSQSDFTKLDLRVLDKMVKMEVEQ